MQSRLRRQGEDTVEARLLAVVSAVRASTNNDDDTRHMSPRELFRWTIDSITRLTKNGTQHTEFISKAVGLMSILDELLKNDTS